MRGCLLEDLLYSPFNTDFRHFIVLFREKTQILWVLLNRATIYHHPRPSTTMHKFAATTHAQPWFPRHQPRPAITSWDTTHNHPQPTIIESPPPTNNDSLLTTLLTIKNSELHFCHHYYSPRRIQEQSKFIRQYPPNTNKNLFSECSNSFYSKFTHY